MSISISNMSEMIKTWSRAKDFISLINSIVEAEAQIYHLNLHLYIYK